MGEVYCARDIKLGREVALKILPEAFAEDRERMARFEREARLLAHLNHPNVAALHGLEEVNGARFLVMELVDGVTLAERMVLKAFANRDKDWLDVSGVILRQGKRLDASLIRAELRPLVELKAEPGILSRLEKLLPPTIR
jgi:serine/threonine protein kinase